MQALLSAAGTHFFVSLPLLMCNLTTIVHKRVNSTDDALVARLISAEADTQGQEELIISNYIQLLKTSVIVPAPQDIPEEMAFMNIYAVSEEDYSIQLCFIPETSSPTTQECSFIRLLFLPEFFRQWPGSFDCHKKAYRFDQSNEQVFPLNAQSRDLLAQLLQSGAGLHLEHDFTALLKRFELATALLRIALAAFFVPDEANHLPACSFLTQSSERSKVMLAEQIIMNSLDQPLTIKELSKQVGMNECYLKKGFKAMFHKTIHEYQQFQRIEKSKGLLLQGNLSINEVAFKMGYGSASHFSTTFKRIAGMKPCDILK